MNTALYPGVPFSPQATITNNIGAADSIIEVSDVSAFPPAPNLATIGTDADGETILYTAKTESALSGCQRGVEGEARGWTAGELIGRNFTAKDHADLISAATDAYGAAIAAQVDAQTAREDAAAAGTVAAAKQDKLTGQPGQVVGFDAGGAAVAVHGWSNQNLLLNSDFRAPVNRNGKMEYTEKGYTIDRWSLNKPVNLNLENNQIHITAANDLVLLIQEKDGLRNILGRTLTLSLLTANSGLLTTTFTLPEQISTTTSIDTTEVTSPDRAVGIDLFSSVSMQSLDQFYVRIIVYANKDAYLVAAKLELGDHQTLAHQDADGNWVLNDPPDYDLQYALCSLYSPSTGAWVGIQHSNPNLLDNWYFIGGGSQQGGGQLPINQRGQTEYAGSAAGTYTLDRWLFENKSSSGGSLTITDAGIQFSRGDDGYSSLIQRFEDKSLAGVCVTFSILCQDGLYQVNFPFLGSPAAGVACGPFRVYCISSGLYIRLLANSASSVTPVIYAVKLELGDHQTLAHQDADGNWVLNDLPPNKALELAKCQRYFEKLHIQHISGFNNSFQYKCTKRGLPSVKFFSPLETADSIGYYTGSSWEDIPAGDIVPYPQATEEVLYLADVGSTSPAVYNFTVWISADL